MITELRIEEQLIGFGLREPVAKQLAHDIWLLDGSTMISKIAIMRHAEMTDDDISKFLGIEINTLRTIMGESKN